MVLQRCPCANPRTYEYVTLHITKDFAGVIKSRILRWGHEAGSSRGLTIIIMALVRRREEIQSEKKELSLQRPIEMRRGHSPRNPGSLKDWNSQDKQKPAQSL